MQKNWMICWLLLAAFLLCFAVYHTEKQAGEHMLQMETKAAAPALQQAKMQRELVQAMLTHIAQQEAEPITTKDQKLEETKEPAGYTEREIYLLARIAMLEASTLEGMGAVCQVVLNRVADVRFPSTVEEVIFQKGQFTPAARVEYDSASDLALEAAKRAAAGEQFVTGTPLYFCSRQKTHAGKTELEEVGGNRFYE